MSAAARLRAEFRAAGYTMRQISVRVHHSTVRVTVRTPAVSIAWVRAIASSAERISRCHVTGEILSGGNTFVEVGHDEATEAALGARYRAAVDAAWPVTGDGGESVKIGGYWLRWEPTYHVRSICEVDGYERRCVYSAGDAAYWIALGDEDQATRP